MTQQDHFQQLLDLPLVRAMPDETRTRVADLLRDVSDLIVVSDGETLLSQGWLGGEAGFVLLNGNVAVSKESGEEIALSAPVLLGEMHQFNPGAHRTATVTARGEATVLKFTWQAFYARAQKHLSEPEQEMLLDSIERIVWERFDRDTLIDLTLFRELPERLRLRVCLPLQWIVLHLTYNDGETLFEREELCGGTGYVLLRGRVQLTKPNFPAETLDAPELIGVMPEFDPALRWTATATAEDDIEVLRFSWQEYVALLERRLSQDEFVSFIAAMKTSAAEHFAH